MSKLIITTQDHIRFINEEDILFCKSDNCYTNIILQNAEELLISKSLAKFSKELTSEKFIRVSQSFLVNINFIRSIDKKKKLLYMTNKLHIHFTISLRDLLSNLGHQGAAILMFSVGWCA